VGDHVAATGAFRCIRRNYPASHIAALVKPSLRPVLNRAPWFDHVIPFDRRECSRRARAAARRTIRQDRFDMAVLFTHSFSSRLLAWSCGVPRRVGVARSRPALLLTDFVDVRRVRGDRPFAPKVELYRALCLRLGCEGADDMRPELPVDEDLRRRAAELLARNGARAGRPLLGLVPGASYGPSKRWPAERFAQVADRFIRDHDFDVAIFTGPGEDAVADAVARAMRMRPVRFPPGAADLDLLQGLIEKCSLVICNDTGPRHYAVALGVPAVTIMGPTDPHTTESPYERGVVLRQDTPCAPCYRRRCPTDHRCMTAITVEQVVSAASGLLSARA